MSSCSEPRAAAVALSGRRSSSAPLGLRIGSIASFQADGKLYDGNGVLPDVRVEPVPEYYVGGRDHVLEEAVRRILQP